MFGFPFQYSVSISAADFLLREEAGLFMNSIHDFLQRRGQRMTTDGETPSLQELTFTVGSFNGLESDERINGLLKFAMESKVKVLSFVFYKDTKLHPTFLAEDIFSA